MTAKQMNHKSLRLTTLLYPISLNGQWEEKGKKIHKIPLNLNKFSCSKKSIAWFEIS